MNDPCFHMLVFFGQFTLLKVTVSSFCKYLPEMPIKFRCSHCKQFLGISRSKAGNLTDCPTCGRTIRVPSLDGTVAPLPEPKLNLDDTELRDALGALAMLNQQSEPGVDENFEIGSARFHASPEHPEVVENAQVEIVEPIAEPLAAVTAENLDEVADPASLADLANSEYAVPIIERESAQSDIKNSYFWFSFTGLLGVVVGTLIGLSVQQKEQAKSPELTKGQVEIEEVPQVDEQVEQEPRLNLTGTITYLSAAGEERPDRGARIVLLPTKKIGQSLLPVDGLQVGATPIDLELLQQSIDILGGSLVLADEEGNYEITMQQPGDYTLLIISKFQAGNEFKTAPADLNQVLSRYFVNGQRALGRLAYYYQTYELKEDGLDRIDYQFSGN